jgi:hypothetical protein
MPGSSEKTDSIYLIRLNYRKIFSAIVIAIEEPLKFLNSIFDEVEEKYEFKIALNHN